MDVKTTITGRYLFALTLVAASLIGSHLLMSRQVANNFTDGYIINISGMQRMLSQRIALMANELSLEIEKSRADDLADELQRSHNQMAVNKSKLDVVIESTGSPELRRLYYGPNAVDERVTHYLALAERLLSNYQTNQNAKDNQRAISREIAEIARNGLLDQLNACVYQHQAELEQKLGLLQRLGGIVLWLGLSILALEALFIFRPMAHQIEQTVCELKSTNDELTEFSYRISHDLRAPIASSLGMTEVLKESLADGDVDDVSNAAQRIGKSMVRLDSLIKDVIDVTRNKKTQVDPEPVTLHWLVSGVVESLSELPSFHRVQVDLDIDPSVTILVKQLFLKQTLANLISNAFKYFDQAESSPHLIVSASFATNHCTLTVADNGIGIPADQRGEIFGMFKRFHPRRSFGSGLGLYLVKQNVQRLDGTITYQPLAKGCKFIIQFPISLVSDFSVSSSTEAMPR